MYTKDVRRIVLAAGFLIATMAVAGDNPKKAADPIDRLVVARHTHFDFGPPYDYYEIYLVRTSGSGTSVARVTLTPAVAGCSQSAKVESSVGHLALVLPQLLEGRNPCAIPEKELRQESQRRKKEVDFTGSNVVLGVSCAGKSRNIQADVFDRRWLEKNAMNLGDQTSWKIRLLEKLDHAAGPSVKDKPILPMGDTAPANRHLEMDAETTEDLRSGKFDALFRGAPDKPSRIFQASHMDCSDRRR